MSYTKIIAKQNGERARIVVTDYALPGFEPCIGVDVFKQHPDGVNWVICTQDPEDAKAAKAMSRADYVNYSGLKTRASGSTIRCLRNLSRIF